MRLGLHHLATFWALVLIISSCTSSLQIQDGQTAFDRKQFHRATTLLLKENRQSADEATRLNTAFLLAQSFDRLNQPAKAKNWYQECLDLGAPAIERYAKTLKQLEEYDAARRAYTQLGKSIGDPFKFRAEETSCQIAKKWKSDLNPDAFEQINWSGNSNQMDYASQILSDGTMYLTSDRNSTEEKELYQWTGNAYSDIFSGTLNSAELQSVSSLNSKWNDGTAFFHEPSQTIYFTRCDFEGSDADFYCRIYSSKKSVETWESPIMLPFQSGNKNYGHPNLSQDGQTLIFSAQDESGFGGFDLMQATQLQDDWGIPQNLGDQINSKGDEVYPYQFKDTLYFSSDFHTGMGGLDIFYTTKVNGTYIAPKNMLPPVNSGADDFGYSINSNFITTKIIQRQSLLSSSRTGGRGADDIWIINHLKTKPKPPPPIDTPIVVIDTPPARPKPISRLTITVLEIVYNNPNDPSSGEKEKVLSSNATINFNSSPYKTDATGKFTIEVNPGTQYLIRALKEGFLAQTKSFETDPPDDAKLKEYRIKMVLTPIIKNKEINLENIYYDYNKWDIRLDAEPTLNELVRLMQDNPNINIELASHTDCRGKPNYNQNLSQKRAQSAVDYLIQNGVSAIRMKAVGYGASNPSINCLCSDCTDEEHQINRRTTFKIVD